jgi:hypothetical protein
MSDAIAQFVGTSVGYFGVYMDAIWGFSEVNNQAKKGMAVAKPGKRHFMSYSPENAPPKGTTRTTEEMNASSLNMVTADVLYDRTKTHGINSQIMAQMTLISIYHIWEELYREKIAAMLNLKSKNELRIDLIGDIRSLRIAIVHNLGIATAEVAKMKHLESYSKGEAIHLSYNQMLYIKNYFESDFRDECLRHLQSS